MKSLLLILALIGLAIPSIAEAHGRGGGHGHRQDRAERSADDHDRGPRRGRGFGRGGPARQVRDADFRPRAKPGKGPKRQRSVAPPRRRMGLGRGQTLPPQLRGPRLENYGRYRLRRPPPGYSYHRRGNRIYLLSDDTGMIFEVVPVGR
jgi:Ni/Co efflux regulator RcnB